ncbi:MAG: hypothetical protein AAFX09_08535 [Pseudomonadota bacterium]
MLLVAEYEIDRAPRSFSRKFCEALRDLNSQNDDAMVSIITSLRAGRPVRRIECSDSAIAARLKSAIEEIAPNLIAGSA